MMYVRVNGPENNRTLTLWCPGCEDIHRVSVGGPDTWAWDGNLQNPTISPSIRVQGIQWSVEDSFYKKTHPGVSAGEQTICHSFLRQGVWEFLRDSTHILAGAKVQMVPLPDWFVNKS